MESLYYRLNKIIRLIFSCFILLTIFFAIKSSNLLLTGTNTDLVTLLILVFLLTFCLLSLFRPFRRLLYFIFVDHSLLTSFIAFFVAISIQIIFVTYIHPVIGFDAGAIHNALIQPKDSEIQGYFSSNVNNIFPLLFQKSLTDFFHNTSWKFCEVLAVLMVDMSVLCNIITVLVIDKHKVPMVIYIQSIWVLFYPMAIVPYTDNWVLPFVSGFILTSVIAWSSKYPVLIRSICAFASGILIMVSYNLKPSATIPGVAIVMIVFLQLLHDRSIKWIKRYLPILLLFSLGSIISYQTCHYLTINQKVVHIVKNREVPAIHFIQIGMTGDGGYSAHDALMMSKLQTKTERENYSKNKILQTLSERKLSYISFLVTKHGLNSSDGTFAWLKEGHFINERIHFSTNKIKCLFQQFTMPGGRYLHDFKFLSQIMWLLITVVLLFGYGNNGTLVQTFRLGIVGAFVYLLIFEGGRSRYLIQFLPMFLILWSLLFDNCLSELKRYYQIFWKA